MEQPIVNVSDQNEPDPVCNFEKCYHHFSIHGHRSHQKEFNCVCKHPTNSALGIGVEK